MFSFKSVGFQFELELGAKALKLLLPQFSLVYNFRYNALNEKKKPSIPKSQKNQTS